MIPKTGISQKTAYLLKRCDHACGGSPPSESEILPVMVDVDEYTFTFCLWVKVDAITLPAGPAECDANRIIR